MSLDVSVLAWLMVDNRVANSLITETEGSEMISSGKDRNGWPGEEQTGTGTIRNLEGERVFSDEISERVSCIVISERAVLFLAVCILSLVGVTPMLTNCS